MTAKSEFMGLGLRTPNTAAGALSTSSNVSAIG